MTYLIISFLTLLLVYSVVNYFYFEAPLHLDQNKSYWALDHPVAVNPSLTVDAEADIVIIGGGYTGLSAAWHLAKENPGKRIILLEAKTLGNGASGRHGGMVLPAIMPNPVRRSAEMAKLKAAYDYSVASIEKIRAIEEASGISCDLVTNGFLYTIFRKGEVAKMQKFAAQFKSYGFPIEYWDKKMVESRVGTSRYEGALYIKDGGSVHAMKLVHALKVLCEREGVAIYENSKVKEICEGKQIKLIVGDNSCKIITGHLVLATNAFTSKLGYFKGKVMPLHLVNAATRPLTDTEMQSVQWACRLPFADSRLALYHLALTPDNRIVIGGGYADYFYNNRLDFKGDKNRISNILKEELAIMFPGLHNLTFDSVWNGVMGLTMDMEEIFGLTGSHQNISYVLGYNGHGVNLSIMYGQVIADLYAGKTSAFLRARDGKSLPIPPEPFRYFGVQPILKFANWYDSKK